MSAFQVSGPVIDLFQKITITKKSPEHQFKLELLPDYIYDTPLPFSKDILSSVETKEIA